MPFLRFAGFTVVRAWQGFWRNAVMSLAATATVILMLVLLAALLIVLAGLDSGLRFIESKVEVTAELRDNIDRPSRQRLIERIEAMPEVTEIEYVSPDEAFRRLREAARAQGRVVDTGGAQIELQAT